ncbi:hypothetical protein OJ996_25130 [Luteolibacter sp. GHJ8]|uniref:Soluble lytic murein transglycosylase n=1 Tax=Luteolibacter rhizosphaerae TaxID=2989719 RepID=A0ABT3GAN6_9BACT|nr:hypothetical protein [Luteolibacter rhizosphaerae]MCW1916897.1 hypothetical protein [Luteolibacter rhizosphaerae]
MSAPSPLVFRSACAAGFLATALAGWHLAAPETRASAGKVVEAGSAVDSKHRERKLRDGGIPAQVRETMAAIRGAATPEQRMRATIDLVQSMPLSDLEQWLENRWFDSGDSYDFTLFNKIAYQRWEAEDPEGLIAYHLKSNSYRAQEMLAKLAKDDPAKALAFCAGRPNPSIELDVLSSVLKVDAKLALQHARAMLERGAFNDSNYYQGDQFFQELVKKDPAALESLFADMPARLRQRAEGALTGQKLKADFAGTLKELMERQDGYKTFRNAYSDNDNIKAGILDHLAGLPDSWKKQIANEPYNLINPDNAGKWLEADLEGMGFSGTDAKNVWNFAIQYYANKNPTEALAMLGNMDLEKGNRDNVIENIFRNAQNDPKKMEALMAALQTDEDRAIAQKFVKVTDENGETVARKEPHLIKEPKEWLEAVMSGDRANANTYTYYIQQWPKEKIEELTTEFRGMAAADKSSLAMLLANSSHGDSGGSAQGLQGEAILYLVNNPPPKEEPKQPENPSPFGPSRSFDANNAASRHAVFLAQKDPDAASQWVQSLPAGETRQWAQKNLAKNWAMYDPEAMQQWVNTLSSTERKGVEEFLEKKER